MKINHGRDSNFFKKITFNNTDWSEDAEFIFNLPGQFSFSLLNENTNAAEIIEYSFNGNTLHGDMTPTKASHGVVFDNRRVSKIWVRSPSGASVTLRVEAWVPAQ